MKNETTTVKDIFIKKEYSLISLVRAYNKATDDNNKLLEVIINNLYYYLYRYINDHRYQSKLNDCEHMLNAYVQCDEGELSKYVQKEYRDFRFYVISTY